MMMTRVAMRQRGLTRAGLKTTATAISGLRVGMPSSSSSSASQAARGGAFHYSPRRASSSASQAARGGAFHYSPRRASSSSSSGEAANAKLTKQIAGVNFPDLIEGWDRTVFYKVGGAATVSGIGLIFGLGVCQETIIFNTLVAAYWAIGVHDMNQKSHTILRNFPVLGNVRYMLEVIRPEIRQYFVEADNEGVPFDRLDRSLVYQRAKSSMDTLPLGTRRDVYQVGYEWSNHSLYPKTVDHSKSRVTIGGKDCKQPYSASLLNISGMSYGALSDAAVLALSKGARMGGFYHNTGEGGISRFHLEGGGDLVWNVGTGYFGCRNPDGTFSLEKFIKSASQPAVKMIEIKLSQGAKPGHGGLLPGAKVTAFIAEARGVEPGVDCNSPPSHSAFKDAHGLCQFIKTLREASGGKPVGFKLCVGRTEEFCSIVDAMLKSNVYPDFITVDGGEGGTGAAPPEFSNSIGTPLREGLTIVNNVLIGAGIRDQIKVICSGKISSGFSIVRSLALGADVCNAARAMMFALGCVQALKCNTNRCPTGITTQDKELQKGLDVESKSVRVVSYQSKTVEYALDILGAMGIDDPAKVKPDHLYKRVSVDRTLSFAELYARVRPGSLLQRTPEDMADVRFTKLHNYWAEGLKLNAAAAGASP